MLDPKYLQDAPEDIAKHFDELETRILQDIARRIAHNNYMMTSTANYQMRKLQELGVTREEIEKHIAETLNITEPKVKQIIKDSAYKTVNDDNSIAKQAGLKPPYTDLTQLILAGIRSTNAELRNICKSTASAANLAFEHAIDQAYLSVNAGATSFADAVKVAVNQLGKKGLKWIDYPTGAHRKPDSAVRNAVRTGINQTAGRCQEKNLDDLDCNIVETTSHMGARPSHVEWQGKLFWRKRPVEGLDNFYDATGYGSGAGLCGWNCRHNFFPNFDGELSAKHYDEEENLKRYELEQEQRYNERQIRYWKRRQAVNKAGGIDNTKESKKVHEWQHRQKELLEKHPDMKRNYARETIERKNSSRGLGASNKTEKYKDGKVIQRGKLTVTDKDTKIKVLKAYEKRLVTLDHERAVVITKDGSVYEVIGTSGRVHPEVLGESALKGAVVTHNHPAHETEYTFSDDDIDGYTNYEMSILRGIDIEYEYQVSNAGETIADADEIDWFSEKNGRHASIALDCRKRGLNYWRKKR